MYVYWCWSMWGWLLTEIEGETGKKERDPFGRASGELVPTSSLNRGWFHSSRVTCLMAVSSIQCPSAQVSSIHHRFGRGNATNAQLYLLDYVHLFFRTRSGGRDSRRSLLSVTSVGASLRRSLQSALVVRAHCWWQSLLLAIIIMHELLFYIYQLFINNVPFTINREWL